MKMKHIISKIISQYKK